MFGHARGEEDREVAVWCSRVYAAPCPFVSLCPLSRCCFSLSIRSIS